MKGEILDGNMGGTLQEIQHALEIVVCYQPKWQSISENSVQIAHS